MQYFYTQTLLECCCLLSHEAAATSAAIVVMLDASRRVHNSNSVLERVLKSLCVTDAMDASSRVLTSIESSLLYYCIIIQQRAFDTLNFSCFHSKRLPLLSFERSAAMKPSHLVGVANVYA